MYWIHKYEVSQHYGGPEEGGWWFDTGFPVEGWEVKGYEDQDEAYEECRRLNECEHKRAERDEAYGYTSVLSYESTHYAYAVEDTSIPKPYPETRPHYE